MNIKPSDEISIPGKRGPPAAGQGRATAHVLQKQRKKAILHETLDRSDSGSGKKNAFGMSTDKFVRAATPSPEHYKYEWQRAPQKRRQQISRSNSSSGPTLTVPVRIKGLSRTEWRSESKIKMNCDGILRLLGFLPDTERSHR